MSVLLVYLVGKSAEARAGYIGYRDVETGLAILHISILIEKKVEVQSLW